MNLTLKKYELMKKLEIPVLEQDIDWLVYDGDGTWYERGNVENIINELAVAAILERACREWIEKNHNVCIEIHESTYAIYGRGFSATNNWFTSFDQAQIAILEYCLEHKKCLNHLK
jgi:nitroimidazol reductase NimA-like FMN-containing flavoprotein (pyridoxamine 5'-phosphate oxidase superfamily)